MIPHMLLFAAAILAGSQGPSARDGELFPTRIELRDRSVHGLPIARDLDGDGRKDLLFQKGARLALFPQSSPAAFPDRPACVVEAPEDAILFDLGELDGDPAIPELVFLTERGVRTVSLRTDPAKENGDAGGSVDRGPGGGARLTASGVPRFVHFVRDVDGDGAADLLLPSPSGFALRRRAADGTFGPPQEIRVPVRGRVRVRDGNLTGHHESEVAYPYFWSGPFDGDARSDLLFYTGTALLLARQTGPGVFEERAVLAMSLERLREVNLMPDQRRGSLPTRNPIAVADVNGDGIRDLAVSEMRTGTTKIYFGREEFAPFERADAVVRIGSWNLGARFTDVDGDGRPDLVVPGTSEVRLAEGLRIVVTRKLPLTHVIHRNRGSNEPFARRADGVLAHEIPVAVGAEASEATEAGFSVDPSILIHYHGDYDGDGRADLLLLEEPDRLAIHLARPEGTYAGEPDRRVGIPDSSGTRRISESVQDVDGDGRSDVYLRYQGADGSERGLLLLTRRPEGGDRE